MMSWMILSKNDLMVYIRKQVKSPSYLKLATSLTNFKCHPCGIFECLFNHQEDKAIAPTTFAAYVGLVDRTNKLILSNCMGMVSSVSVIFDTGATYSCLSNKGEFVNLEVKFPPRNIKGISKVLVISGFGIVKYSFRS